MDAAYTRTFTVLVSLNVFRHMHSLKRAHLLVPFLQLIQYSVTVALGSVTWHCDKQPGNIRK